MVKSPLTYGRVYFIPIESIFFSQLGIIKKVGKICDKKAQARRPHDFPSNRNELHDKEMNKENPE